MRAAGASHAGSLGLRVLPGNAMPAMTWQQHAGTRVAPRLQRLLRTATTVQTVTTAGQKKLTVVLDMDECLIHSTDFSDNAGGYRQSEERPDAVKQTVETFVLEMADGVTCMVHKRPGLLDFLKAWYATNPPAGCSRARTSCVASGSISLCLPRHVQHVRVRHVRVHCWHRALRISAARRARSMWYAEGSMLPPALSASICG
jgi:hypothetical protein